MIDEILDEHLHHYPECASSVGPHPCDCRAGVLIKYLERLKEPTEGMVIAGRKAFGAVPYDYVLSCHHAILKAAEKGL